MTDRLRYGTCDEIFDLSCGWAIAVNRNGETITFSAIVAMAIAAGVILATGEGSQRSSPEASEFQRLVRGLGLGPAQDLSECAFDFDPRLMDACQNDLWPIPGGVYFCRNHACSIFYLPVTGRTSDQTD